MAQLATLIDPNTGKKVVVESGSQDAQGYFSSGYQLMGADGKPVSSTTPTTPPAPEPPPQSPPAVVTSEQARTQTAKDVEKLAKLSQPVEPVQLPEREVPEPVSTAKYVFETDDGRSIYGTVNQYGDFVPDQQPQSGSPEDIALKADKGAVRRISDAEAEASQMLTTSERRLNNYLDEIERLKGRVDENLATTLSSITQSYERRREEQRRLNQAIMGGTALIEARTGRARYAQQISQDILTKKEQEGLDQLALIDQQEQLAVQAAQDAADEKKFKLLNDQMTQIENLRAQKNKLIFDLQAEARAQVELAMNKAKMAMEQQQMERELIREMLPSFASGLIEFSETGEVLLPDENVLQQIAENTGVPYVQLLDAVRTKASELSQLDREARKEELDILRAQQDLIPEMFKEYEYARNMYGYQGDLFSFVREMEAASDIENIDLGETTLSRDALILRLGKQVFGTRISDAEREFLTNMVDKGIEQGIPELDLIDTVLGYNIERNKPLANSLKQMLLQSAGEEGLAGFDMLGLARLINEGKDEEAIRKAEAMALSEARKADPDGYFSESLAKTQIRKADDLRNFLNGLDVDEQPISVVSGSMEKYIKRRFRGKEEQEVLSRVTDLTADMITALAGVNVTENEKRFLEPLIPDINDTPANFMIKLEQLENRAITGLNEFRGTYGLPKINKNVLLNPSEKQKLYEGLSADELKYSSYDSFLKEATLQEKQELKTLLQQNEGVEGVTFDDIFEFYVQDKKKMNKTSAATVRPNNYVVTGFGSSFWDKGLDISIGGGGAEAKGKPVSLPFGGTVIEVKGGYSNPNARPLPPEIGKKQNGGWGNQVKLKLDDGQEVWINHLDSIASLKPGQKIAAGTVLGTQGNTGKTIGPTGVHVDITMKDANGNYFTPQKVKQFLDKFA